MANTDEDPSQKTESPTARRLEKAREEGDVPISRELRSWALLLTLSLFMYLAGTWFLERVSDAMIVFLSRPEQLVLTRTSYDETITTLLLALASAMGVLFLALVIGVLLSTWSQIGILWAPKKLKPNPQAINPIRGLKQKLSRNNLVEFAKSLAKISLIMLIGYFVLRPYLDRMPELVGQDLSLLPDTVLDGILLLLAFILAAYAVIVVADVLWQRYSYTERMKMTVQQVRDERKDIEGNPEIKRRIARLRAERARVILTQAMQSASVVVTNPTHYAVALNYDQDTMPAPIVVAKGIDFMAARIRDLAEHNEIPIYQNPPLARLLYDTVDVDQEIDPSQYEAVAEVIRFVWSRNQRAQS